MNMPQIFMVTTRTQNKFLCTVKNFVVPLHFHKILQTNCWYSYAEIETDHK
jgi:hypothetical protein